MTNDEFTAEVRKRNSTVFTQPYNTQLLHAMFGLVTESGELADAYKKCMFYGKPLDLDNIKEEVGDISWYVALASYQLGTTIEELMEMNTRKLEARYGRTWSKNAALNRNLAAEAAAMKDEPPSQYNPI
jgi:NTP pyrophosphatase (non-canonical NTP hydrolase)